MAAKQEAAAVYVPIDSLVPWAGNPRDNADAIPHVAASIERFGFGSPIIARKADNEIIGGHTRWAAAKSLGMAKVPVRFLDLSQSEARALALSDNRLAEISLWDADKLQVALVDLQEVGALDLGLAGFDNAELDAAFGNFDDSFDDSFAPPQDEAPIERAARSFEHSAMAKAGFAPLPASAPRLDRNDVPDALWPTDNEWGVPLLDINSQADALDMPVVRWGRFSRITQMRGTWHFYTDDRRFESLWSEPFHIVNSGAVAFIEPNFSTAAAMPRAAALWATFRKRWLARYWQSQGLRCWVDLNVADEHADLNLLGVPKGWRTFATRGYTRFVDTLPDAYATAARYAAPAAPLFMVYGGGKAVKEACLSQGWLWVPEERDEINGAKIAKGHEASSAVEDA